MAEKRGYPVGVQTFEEVVAPDCVYVDKTEYVYKMATSKAKNFFLSRPRRFGKTITMNMLNCFFSNRYEGRSDLFEGFDIWKEEKYRKLQGTYPSCLCLRPRSFRSHDP